MLRLSIFAQVILWCLEAGLVNQWKVRTWARMKAEEEHIMVKDEEASDTVTLSHLLSTFFLYLIMLFFASLTFGIEMFPKWRKKREITVFKFTP